MKTITFNENLQFILPDHWIAEATGDAFICYEQGEDNCTLFVEILIAMAPSDVDEDTCIEMLNTLIEGGGDIVRLDLMRACKYQNNIIIEDGQQLLISNWYIAGSEKPNIGKLASFSYVAPANLAEDDKFNQILGMLDSSIRSCRFI